MNRRDNMKLFFFDVMQNTRLLKYPKGQEKYNTQHGKADFIYFILFYIFIYVIRITSHMVFIVKWNETFVFVLETSTSDINVY